LLLNSTGGNRIVQWWFIARDGVFLGSVHHGEAPNMRTLWLFIAMALPCAGQTFPGLQLVQPDPGTGYPLLVATPCAQPEEGSIQAWARPIMVYEDSMQALFVDKNCLIAAVQMGFGQSGKYMVAMYSHYKSTDYPCKYLFGKATASLTPEKQREFQSECKMIGYRVRWIDVDTRAKRMIVSRAYFLDINGFHALTQKGADEWTQLSDLEKDPLTRPTARAIDRTTNLVEKELAYFNYRYK
jgi:hypothetical protein